MVEDQVSTRLQGRPRVGAECAETGVIISQEGGRVGILPCIRYQTISPRDGCERPTTNARFRRAIGV